MNKLISDEIRDKIAKAAGVEVEKVNLEHPKVDEFGDFSTNIALRNEKPREYAQELAIKLRDDPMFAKVEVAGGGFLNIWLRNEYFVNVLNRVLIDGIKSITPLVLDGKRIVIDYSAPNIAKYFGIGHLRSTIIGQAIYNTMKFLGANVIGDNHLGDWGTQFGKLMFMISREKLESFNIAMLEDLYVEFHKHPDWEEEGKKWFKKLEDGDSEARNMWKKCIEVSMTEFERIYEILGVKIDEVYGESFYENKMSEIIDLAKKTNLARISEGALIVETEASKAPLILVKSDGGTTYATRDLATLKFRREKWDPDEIIYEVGAEQTEYFKQIFEVGRKMGIVRESVKLVHTRHGMYLGLDGKKFKTRTGNTIRLEEVLEEAIERARKLGNTEDDKARAVGVGAIKYFDLMHSVQSDIIFEWEKVMNLEGNSGPYLQYTFARTQSVLAKSGRVEDLPDGRQSMGDYLPNIEELRILRWLYRFPEVISEAANRYAPSLVCTYLFELAQRFNGFYNKHSILTPEEKVFEVRDFRLKLTGGVGEVMKTGLKLLGIEALEKM